MMIAQEKRWLPIVVDHAKIGRKECRGRNSKNLAFPAFMLGISV
jgi:hypothetical protein